MRYIYFALVMLYVFSLKAQVLYVKDFGTSYSGWSYSANYTSGVADNGGTTIRSCTFGNGDDFTGMGTYARYTKSNIYDPIAQNYDWLWDSVVFKFRYRTEGYARDFRVIFDYLVGAGSIYEYDVRRNYFQPDSEDVSIVVSGPTGNALNCEIGLIKYDTTLNNFKVYLSNLSIKGYITYSPVGLSEYTDSKNAVLYNSETLFFTDKWLHKKYWITNIQGREYVSGIVNSNEEKINLENGLYILRTENTIQKILIAH
jgi:hypothetical protein